MQRANLSTGSTADFAVLMCGLPGKMGHSVAETVVKRWGAGALLPFSSTGPGMPDSVDVVGKGAVKLMGPEQRDAEWGHVLEAAQGRPIIAIDYTHPDVAVDNVAWYRGKGLPFVMGTTGYDEKACREAIGGDLYAVLAPNMGKPIVLLQSMLAHAAETYPGGLGGYKLNVVESHQKGKADTSGTAKAVVNSLAKLTAASYDVEEIQMIREPQEQLEFGVAEDFIPGHAYHTYTLTSPDGTVELEIKHNVDGRAVYGEGTCDAVEFLYAQIQAGTDQRIWSMLDILKAGRMN